VIAQETSAVPGGFDKEAIVRHRIVREVFRDVRPVNTCMGDRGLPCYVEDGVAYVVMVQTPIGPD